MHQISCLLILMLCTLCIATSNIFQVFEECNAVEQHNISYKFNVWILVPFENDYKFSKARVQPALNKARSDVEDFINQTNSKTLSSAWDRVIISVDYKDTKCNADTSTKVASDIHDVSLLQQTCNDTGSGQMDADVIIGVSCDYAAGRVATLANHWNWPLIYPGTRTSTFDTKAGSECCTTMVRPGITRSDFGDFMVEFFNLHKWNHSLILYTTRNSHGAHVDANTPTDCATAVGGIADSFRLEGWNRYEYYDYIFRDSDDKFEVEMEAILTEIKGRVRVSIWCLGRRTMRRVMKTAESLNMTGGDHAFIYIDLYNSNSSYFWTDDDDNLAVDTSNPDDVIDIITPYKDDYLQALTVVSLKIPSDRKEYKEFSDHIKNEIAISSKGLVVEYNEFVNPFISLYYDAMVTFIYGIIKSYCNGTIDLNNGEKFAEILWDTEFESIGRNVTISKSGDREMEYVVLDMDRNSKMFKVALEYPGVENKFVTLNDIDWPGKNAPVNIPTCGYKNEFCPGETETSQTVLIAVGVCTAVILFACVVMIILFRKMKAEKRLLKKAWRVRWEEIDWSWPHRRSSSFCDLAGQKELSHSIASSAGSHHVTAGKQVFTKIGKFRGKIVAVKEIKRKRLVLDRDLLIELEEIHDIDHNHICNFIGAIDEPPHISILTEYCARGSLQDFLEDNREYEIKDFFKNSLISDIINGMSFLHRSYFKYHGNLKSSNCLIDNRFQVKLTDFGLVKFREGSRTDSVTGFKYYENKLWTAPELLRSLQSLGTPKGDVYSFAVVVQEIIYRKGVFYTKAEHSPQDILYQLTCPLIGESPFRPTLEDGYLVVVDPRLRNLVQKCWSEDPHDRPTFPEIEKDFKKLKQKKNLVDSLLERLDNYSTHLEEKVDERTIQYKAEKERADSLLFQMLPKAVAEQLKKGNNVLPTSYDSVTIFFSDIVGFTAISHDSQPMQVVNMLNDLYTMFDEIIDKFDVYKVETIGDAYMVVSGLPNKNGNRHAREIARMSLSLLDCVQNKFKIQHMPATQLKLRVGIHTGPVVAGVVGSKMPRYCLFGDTVNTAARMESNSKPYAIHVSPKTKKVLEYFETFRLEQREDEVFLKGLGTWKTWWLKGEDFFDLASITSDHAEEEEREEVVIKPSPRFSKANPLIVTFDTDSPVLSNRLSPPSRWMSMNHKSPPSIIKESRDLGAESPIGANFPKRHRLGVVKKHEFTDHGLVLREKRAKISQLNMELISACENGNHVDNCPSNKTNRKVQFDNYSHSNEVGASFSKAKTAKKSGRDSGIELGFDNPLCLEDLSSEDDYL